MNKFFSVLGATAAAAAVAAAAVLIVRKLRGSGRAG